MQFTEAKKYLETTTVDVQSAKATVSAFDLVYSPYVNFNLFPGVDVSPSFVHYRDDIFHQIMDYNRLLAMGRTVYEKYLANPDWLDGIMAEHRALTGKLDRWWQAFLSVDHGTLDDSTLAGALQEFADLSRLWWQYGLLGEDKGFILGHVVIPNFAKRHSISEDAAHDAVTELGHPSELSIFNAERLDFYELCRLTLEGQNAEAAKAAENYLKKYFWFESNFYHYKEITPQSLIQKVQAELAARDRAAIHKEIEKINGSFGALSAKKLHLQREYKLTKEDEADLYFAERTIAWLEERKIGMMKDFYYFSHLLELASERLHFTFKQLGPFRVHEIIAALEGKSTLSMEAGEARLNGSMFVYERGKEPTEWHGNEAKELLALATKATTHVKGTVASKGGKTEVRGTATIVLDPEKDAFVSGNILVTSMTRVEFLPLMKQAKAVITDEGGIACHAAIVSRELGIPCIIATKNATRVLKSGQTVELNLTSGDVVVVP